MAAKKTATGKTAKVAKKATPKVAKTSTSKAPAKTAPKPAKESDASEKISKRVETLGDWRGETLAHMRTLILEADPQMEEGWKWAKATSPGVPVWSHHGIVCTGETYKQAVKFTFAYGASVSDPKKLFNASLEGATRRAIDIHEGEKINEAAFKALIRAAVAVNAEISAERKAKKK